MSHITGIEHGLAITGRSPAPYALAVLDCGHKIAVVLGPTLLACCHCGTKASRAHNASFAPCLTCNRQMFDVLYSPSPANDADILTQIGDVVPDCSQCAYSAAMMAKLETLLASGTFHHATYRELGTLWEGLYIYAADADGFRGYKLVGSFGKHDANLERATMLVRGFGTSVGSYGNG